MRYFADLRIGTRLALAFAAITGLLVVVATIGVVKINAVDHNTEVIVHDRYVKIALAQSIENEVNKPSRALRTALLTTDPCSRAG